MQTIDLDEIEIKYLNGLIDKHWQYIENTLVAHDAVKKDIAIAKHHYKSAFNHGWKHAFEYMMEVYQAEGDEDEEE